MTELYNTESPIDRKRRNNINATWDDILSRFANLQRQINILAGGQEVDELIARIERAIEAAENDVQNFIAQVNESVQQAINENNNALQTALQTVSVTLDELNIAISNAETATEDATNAKNATIQATQDAQEAINTMQSLIDNFGSRGTWSSATQYFKNNLVGLDGRTYIALEENINKPVTNQSVWALFADKGAQGPEGPRGLPGKDGKDGTGVNIIGGLTSEDDLPTVGTPGDAYMIGGDLYVWQDDTDSWKNVGPIQGPEGKSAYDLVVENGFEGTMEEWIVSLKGEQGPPGPDGPAGPPGQDGKDADLTEVTAQLGQIVPKVDNSWQMNKYNATSSMNLGDVSHTKTFQFHATNWKSTTNVETLFIVFPTLTVFSGIIKITASSNYNNTDAGGGCTVEYNTQFYSGTLHKYSKTITTISPGFAQNYYLNDLTLDNTDKHLLIPIFKAPTANNVMAIEVTLIGNNVPNDIMSKAYITSIDEGSPTALGYPWTPQTTSFMDKKQNNLISGSITSRSTFPLIFAPDGTQSHVFHKSPNLYIAPADIDGNNPNWGLATIFMLDGTVHMPKLIVDGVDLKQSVSNGKAQVASAITGKGVQTASDATFETMANNINKIPTGVGYSTGSIVVNTSMTTATTYLNGSAGPTMYYFDVSNLSFTPKFIIAIAGSGIVQYQSIMYANDYLSNNWSVKTGIFNAHAYSSPSDPNRTLLRASTAQNIYRVFVPATGSYIYHCYS
ncbi:hypothetical protein [Lysinibacillus sp. NPDC047702]|uniref:hypothetical protein n=1 Tax=unclassified Lysinibacillus TaxID=2636778 RepID=UPI003D036E63